MAFAGQQMDALFDDFVVEVVVFDFFEEVHKGLFEIVPTLLDVDQRPTHHDQFKLIQILFDLYLDFPIGLHDIDLRRKVLSLRIVIFAFSEKSLPIKHSFVLSD